MDLWQATGRQLVHPRGWPGRVLGYAMRLANHRPNALAVAALDLEPWNTVLDLGCGPGHAVKLAARRLPDGIVHGVDQSPAMLAQALTANRRAIREGRIHLHRACFDRLPLPEQSVDKILAANVAYFWQDEDAILRELRRVLRPGGRLVVYVTHRATMQRWRFADPETHRLFDHEELRELLRAGATAGERLTIADLSLPFGVRGMIATLQMAVAAQ